MKEKLTKESTGYAQIKNEVLIDTKISLKAKGLFAYLYSKPDDWDFSGDRMAKENMEGRRAIYAALKELETEGYLSRTKKHDGKVVYHISFTKKPNVQNGQQAKKPNARNSKEPKQQRAKTGSISNKDINTNKEVIHQKIDFMIFWNLYDKKVGKPKSEKKWYKLSLDEQKKIIEYIPKYKISQPNKVYRKNPETFFNNRSWEDEIILGSNNGYWKCRYGFIHKKGEECGHDQELKYKKYENRKLSSSNQPCNR